MEESQNDTPEPEQPVTESEAPTPDTQESGGEGDTGPLTSPREDNQEPTVPSAATVMQPEKANVPAPAKDTAAAVVTDSTAHTTPSGRKHRFAGWLISILILIVIGVGLFLVYHYGQTKNTPVTTTKKDVALLRVSATEPLPVSFYPNVDDSAYTNDVDSQAFEGLTSFYDLTKVGPQLALSWTNPDASTWIFKLRPNVKFHTGRTMTANDVKASLDDIQNFSLGPEFGSTIKEVSVVDPLTVKITTNGADPILPNELSELFIYDTTSKTPNNPINGTGPYTIKPGTSTKNSIDLVAFDDYYGGKPYVRELDFTSYDTTAEATAAAKAGKVDIAEVSTKANADSVKNSNLTALVLPSPLVAHLVPNTLNGSPFSKLAVRQAIMQAIDIPTLLKARGITGTPATQTIAPTIPGYDPAITRPAYDVNAAKKALADAGYPNGFSFTFTYYAAAQDLADELTRQLALVGVTVKQDPQTDFNVLGDKVFGGLTDMYYNSLSTSLVDASDYISPVLVDSKYYDNPDISKIFTQASQTLDPTKRLSLLKQVSDMMTADRADIPLYVGGNTYYMVPKNVVLKQMRQGGNMGIDFSQAYGQ